ncbi:hypothetical protein C5S35_07850 [Candidatus Methanophagaceae archaeon]|nr:hypothetical protein C5S35_07850 [Methanophagales archaeon]
MAYHNPKIVTVLAGLLFLLATATMAPALPLDSSSSSYATEHSLAGNWIEKADTPASGGYGEALVGTEKTIYIARCYNVNCNPTFWGYDSETDSWYSMNTSGLPKGAFRNGAALAWDSDDYIYALLGARYKSEDGNRSHFYRYSITNDSWARLADSAHAQGAGDAITWSGYDDYIYAIAGNKDRKSVFGYYNHSNDSWTELPFNPNWTSTDDGAALVWTGGDYLYALRGEWQEGTPNQDFARFHIPTKSWANLSHISESEGVGDGASLLWKGWGEYSDFVFALGGGNCLENPGYNFYGYCISSNKWESLEPIPCPIGCYVGNRLGFANGNIYYWHGAPSSWDCGGDAFYMFELMSSSIFNTGPGAYPSIFGTHKGTITLNQTITVRKLYTYPCKGTGGHTEYARIWNSTFNAIAIWSGYGNDWRNVYFEKEFTLVANERYNYTVRTGSYPQIIHVKEINATGGKDNLHGVC